MDWFTLVKRYYDNDRYNKDNVAVFVQANKITDVQYEEITGETFTHEGIV
ncbi:XkdX family protein [Bacillus sp. FJAT-26390]|nr:XkdX family protein [Bacillus sp. FJAT-26390]